MLQLSKPTHQALLSCLLLLALCLIGAKPKAASIITIDESFSQQALTSNIDFLENSQTPWSLAEITAAPLAQQFAPLKGRNNFQQHGSIWLRFIISNSTAETSHLWLYSPHLNFAKTDVYQIDSASKAIKSGNIVLNNFSAARIILEPHSSTQIFLAIENASLHNLSLKLGTPTQLLLEQALDIRQYTALLSAFLILAGLSLMLAISTRNQSFLALALYALAICVLITLIRSKSQTSFATLATYVLFISIFIGYFACIAAFIRQQKIYLAISKSFYLWLSFNSIACISLMVTLDYHHLLVWPFVLLSIYLPLHILFRSYQQTKDNLSAFLIISRILGGLALTLPIIYSQQYHHLNALVTPSTLAIMLADVIALFIAFSLHYQAQFKRQSQQQNLMALNYNKLQDNSNILLQLSQDLRTPISTIITASELLKNAQPSRNQLEILENIDFSSKSLMNQLSDVIHRVQSDSGQSNLIAPFELRLLIDECFSGIADILRNKNIEIISDIDDDIPYILEGNAYYLRQIITVLLRNAITFTQEGTITLTINSLSHKDGMLQFSIRDTGRGIDKKTLEELLKPQHANATARQESGLALLKILLAQLHSSLHISSKLGRGSEFSFELYLPLSKLSADIQQNDASILQAKHLLIVDDNYAFSRTLHQQTNNWGLEALESHDGTEAIAIFRAKKNLSEYFDFIILDSDLPHLSGIEVAAKITEESVNKPVIILLNSQNSSPDKKLAFQAGVDVILNKPVSQRLLQTTMVNLLQNPRSEQTAKNNSSMRILIAEDNDVSRRVISKMMDMLNINYKLVSDGQLAVDAANRERFDLILMDCEMPIMDGFDATENIHAAQQQRNQKPSPVIALTAHVFEEHRQRSEKSGMQGFLEKPIQMEALQALIEQYSQH